VQKKDARRDKTPQIQARIAEFYDRAQTHWASLLSTLLLNGPSTVCYDGQFYFDTDHSEGSSGSQDNDITVDISALPAAVHGVVTAPSVEEMQQTILKAITQTMSFKDDRGEPMNENARRFLVVVPVPLYIVAVAAVSTLATAALQQNLNPNIIAGLTVDVQMNARLTWTDSFSVFRTDSPIKGLIRQTEQDVELKSKAEGSEFEFDNDAWQFGIDAWRGVGYGYWQRACYVTMT
jgi:phage major head subunit gpT-like protein